MRRAGPTERSAGPSAAVKDVGQEIESYSINGHDPYTVNRDMAPLGDSGKPETSSAEEAPLDDACPTCQTQANLRRWI